MRRVILFRGKTTDTGEWIEGFYFYKDRTQEHGIHCSVSMGVLMDRAFEVIPETIGQFTGLTDKKRVKIFEGDILLSESWGSNTRSKRKTHIVEWGWVGWLASGYNGGMMVKPWLDVKSDWQVIGNIHDNKELIK